MIIDEAEIAAVTAFVDDKSKTLDGNQPEWRKEGRGDFQAIWPIVELNGRIRSQLRFRLHPDFRDTPSISLIFRDRNVARFDRVPMHNCEENPLSALRLGLPARVCGPHVHRWLDNAAHVATSGRWELPVRRPVTDPITNLQQTFLWFCNEINVALLKDHRQFVEPPSDLLH